MEKRKMKNEYEFKLYNPKADGVPYDTFWETNLKRGRSYACGRGETRVVVWKNGKKYMEYRTR